MRVEALQVIFNKKMFNYASNHVVADCANWLVPMRKRCVADGFPIENVDNITIMRILAQQFIHSQRLLAVATCKAVLMIVLPFKLEHVIFDWRVTDCINFACKENSSK